VKTYCGSGPRWLSSVMIEVEEPPSRGGKTINALVRILTMCQQHEDMRFAASELHDQLLKAMRESVKEGS